MGGLNMGGLNIHGGLNTGASTVDALRRGSQHPRRLNIGCLNLPEASIQWYQPPRGLNSGGRQHGGLNIPGYLNTGASTMEASKPSASTSERPQRPDGFNRGLKTGASTSINSDIQTA